MISSSKNDRVANTQRVRTPVPAPTTFEELLELFARGLDESHFATRLNR